MSSDSPHSASILTYCTNVHAIEAPDEAFGALERFCRPVGEAFGALEAGGTVGAQAAFPLGLWLSRRAATHFAEAGACAALGQELGRLGLSMVTLNGFPYGDFHAASVKGAVYQPDWSDPARAQYTLDLAMILATLLPSDVREGTISTLPVGDAAVLGAEGRRAGAEQLVGLAVELDRLAQVSGRSVRVCLEPEPECVVETTSQTIAFFDEEMRPAARRAGVSDEILARHLGLCFDTCHQAVCFEDPAASWRRLREAGITVGKIQISSALSVPNATARDAAALLMPFDEPRFLHQVRRTRPGGAGPVEAFRDLADAFGGACDDDADERFDWRVHFHVPLHWEPEDDAMTTTFADVEQLMPVALAGLDPWPHLEVETYTWSVLPEALRPTTDASLIAGIVRELERARGVIES